MARTFALYVVPKDMEQAVRFGKQKYSSARDARIARRSACFSGTEVAVHAGEEHPNPLSYGEVLWREVK